MGVGNTIVLLPEPRARGPVGSWGYQGQLVTSLGLGKASPWCVRPFEAGICIAEVIVFEKEEPDSSLNYFIFWLWHLGNRI